MRFLKMTRTDTISDMGISRLRKTQFSEINLIINHFIHIFLLHGEVR